MDEKEIVDWVNGRDERTIRLDSKFFPDEEKLHAVLFALGTEYEAVLEQTSILIRPKSK